MVRVTAQAAQYHRRQFAIKHNVKLIMNAFQLKLQPLWRKINTV